MGSWRGFARWLLGQPLRVLFVGNSLTYFEPPDPGQGPRIDLPGLLARMSRARGERRSLVPHRLCCNAACLEDHAADRGLDRELDSVAWDWVVLQENSGQIPEATRRCLPALCARIQAAGARALLFEPWRPATGGTGEVQSWRGMAAQAGAILAPAAQAWREASRARPGLNLCLADGKHPSPLGAYLAACVLYGCLYGRSPETRESAVIASDSAAVRELGETPCCPSLVSEAEQALLRELSWRVVRQQTQVEPPVPVHDPAPLE